MHLCDNLESNFFNKSKDEYLGTFPDSRLHGNVGVYKESYFVEILETVLLFC